MDVIDSLVGIAPGSALDAIRARRPEARTHAQASWRALFAPGDLGQVSAVERYAAAVFVVALHGESATADFYREGLAGTGAAPALRAAVEAAVAEAGGQGPYGRYPTGPLSAEDSPGASWQPNAALQAALGPRLAAAFAHLHMLVFHPRDADPASLQSLLDAGWSTTGIVTLSQLVSFLAFQVRVVSGLRTLAACS
jgi:CMD domain protein